MVRVAAAAVCEAAARRPGVGSGPASTVSTGIRRVTRRAVRENARGLPKDSRCSRARSVRPSLSHHWSMSLPLTSYLSPSETKEETPMPSRDSPSSSAMPTPPDCTATPAVPGRGWPAAKVASRRSSGSVLADAEAVGADEPHAVRAAGGQQRLRLVGVEAGGDDEQGPYARLAALLGGLRDRGGGYGEHREVGVLGRALTDGVGRHAEDRVRGGFTANRRPVKPPACRWCRIARPTEPGLRPAPTTATALGPQQRLQAGDVGGPAAFLDGREVGVALVEGDGAAHLGALEAAGRAQAEVGEEPQHLVVLD